MLQEAQQKAQQLEMANKDKTGEIAVKAEEVNKRYEAAMAKVQADLQMAAAGEAEESRRMVIQEALDALKQRVEGVSMVHAKPFENMDGMMTTMNDSSAALAAVRQSLMQAAESLAGAAGKTKTVSIQAPSGATYTGTVTEQ